MLRKMQITQPVYTKMNEGINWKASRAHRLCIKIGFSHLQAVFPSCRFQTGALGARFSHWCLKRLHLLNAFIFKEISWRKDIIHPTKPKKEKSKKTTNIFDVEGEADLKVLTSVFICLHYRLVLLNTLCSKMRILSHVESAIVYVLLTIAIVQGVANRIDRQSEFSIIWVYLNWKRRFQKFFSLRRPNIHRSGQVSR